MLDIYVWWHIEGVNNAGEELVDIVDQNDNALYQCTRKEMRANVLCHRAVFIIVVNSAGELLIHQRSAMKDLWPSWWDIAVGVAGVPLTSLGMGTYSDDMVSVAGKCFMAKYDGPLVLPDSKELLLPTLQKMWNEVTP